jgi:Motility quorum-sensing regulator, toxin of MqsA
MVTQWMEVRDKPECALARIKELAAQQAVILGGRRVQNHIANLRYSFEAVCECLTQLSLAHFTQSERYTPDGPWHDIFLMTYRGPANCDDSLYIKLRLDHGCVNILLFSFHLEGAL